MNIVLWQKCTLKNRCLTLLLILHFKKFNVHLQWVTQNYKNDSSCTMEFIHYSLFILQLFNLYSDKMEQYLQKTVSVTRNMEFPATVDTAQQHMVY